MDSTVGQSNDNKQYGRRLEEQTEKRSGRLFSFSWRVQNIWSMYLIDREGQLATKPGILHTLPTAAQMNAAFEAPAKYVKVLLFGQFWEQHRRKPFPRQSEGSDGPKYFCVPQGGEGTLNCLCKHMWHSRLCQRCTHQSIDVCHPSVLVAFGN